jgi:hypothetical protein
MRLKVYPKSTPPYGPAEAEALQARQRRSLVMK